MTSTNLLLDDYYELLALHRALLEAKFCDEPNDFDVSASPIIARIYKKLIPVLIEAESKKKGEGARQSWDRWLRLDPSRREWGVALKRAKSERKWASWSPREKRSYVADLLTPFVLEEEIAEKFVLQVEE